MIRKRALFPFSFRDLFTTLFFLGAATLLSFLLRLIDRNDSYVPTLFILAVFLVSRYTNGYLFGTLGSFFGVILVNYIFTYPYFAFNFTISGYPITFLSMLATSIMTCTMTTRIKEHEALRIEAEREKMRGNLLRAVSHDLRTPLTSILGTTSALLDNEGRISQAEQHDLLQDAHDDAQWLIRMVENLLSVTRVSSGETQIQKSPEAVEEIVGESVRKFKKRFPDADIHVSVPHALLMVPMDAMLIEQVLINLLENAVLHGHSSKAIRIRVERAEGNACFIVADQGVGISKEAFAHLFDGYLSDVSSEETDGKRNMGIGLSVCMSIVKAHGGTMTAENSPSGGAVFRFTLPLGEEASGDEQAKDIGC